MAKQLYEQGKLLDCFKLNSKGTDLRVLSDADLDSLAW